MLVALIFDTDAPFLPEKASGSSLPPSLPAGTRLAGLTLLQRTVRMAWKAGAEEVWIMAADPEAANRLVQQEPPRPLPIRVLPVAGGAPPLLSPADQEFLVLAAPLLGTDAGLARLRDVGRTLGRPVRAITSGGSEARALFLAGSALAAKLRPGADLAGVVCALAADPAVERCEVPFRRLDSPEALAEADRSLYVGLTSISDGWVDRVFNRKISGWVTRHLIHLPITPNQVTWFHFSLGLLAAALFWRGDYLADLLGAIFFQLSVALDCTDGEIARIKYLFSRFGSRLDVAADNVVTVAVFAAIAHAAAERLGTGTALTLGAFSVTGVLACIGTVLWMARLQARVQPGEASALSVTNRLSDQDQMRHAGEKSLVDRVINEATSRDYSVIVVAFALLGRLEWFAWLAAIGSHLFWIVFGLIQYSRLQVRNVAQGR
ncbi:MAG: CDP-alcohol phosphatidyltransferase family protein [Armatimonadetes bacterium]|nr:CDP-alcohol phosphatidyltransferase family protein [Armatimonadota bacterium]